MSATVPLYVPSPQDKTGTSAPVSPAVKRAPHHVLSGTQNVTSGTRSVAPGPHSSHPAASAPAMPTSKVEEPAPKRPTAPHAQSISSDELAAPTGSTMPDPTRIVTDHAHPSQHVGRDQSMGEQVNRPGDESALNKSESISVPAMEHAHPTELASQTERSAPTQTVQVCSDLLDVCGLHLHIIDHRYS